MGTYTVIGLRNAARGGELTVAAVVEGECAIVDSEPGSEYASRWAQAFDADGPDEAERMAVQHCLEDD